MRMRAKASKMITDFFIRRSLKFRSAALLPAAYRVLYHSQGRAASGDRFSACVRIISIDIPGRGYSRAEKHPRKTNSHNEISIFSENAHFA